MLHRSWTQMSSWNAGAYHGHVAHTMLHKISTRLDNARGGYRDRATWGCAEQIRARPVTWHSPWAGHDAHCGQALAYLTLLSPLLAIQGYHCQQIQIHVQVKNKYTWHPVVVVAKIFKISTLPMIKLIAALAAPYLSLVTLCIDWLLPHNKSALSWPIFTLFWLFVLIYHFFIGPRCPWGPIYGSWLSNSKTICRFNWCDSGWWG